MKKWSEKELLAYLDRVLPALDKLDHFDILDVAADADSVAVQAAFHQKASTLHPDRHRGLNATNRERLTVVYGRIAEAYRVLRNDDERHRYVVNAARSLQTKKGEATANPGTDLQLDMLTPKAKQLYRRAQAALRTGDRNSALLNLRMALRQDPNSQFLRDALETAAKHE